jgi:hypothetical protein
MTLDVVRGDAERSSTPSGRRADESSRHPLDLAAPVAYLVLACWLF